MLQIINPNSYTIAAAIIFLIALGGVWARGRRSRRAWLGLGALAILLVAINLIFRVGASEIETASQFDQVLAGNQPVVLEIYSNY